MEAMLDGLGYQLVEWAASAPAALQALDEGEFEGALLDVNLSGTTVYPVVEALAFRRLVERLIGSTIAIYSLFSRLGGND